MIKMRELAQKATPGPVEVGVIPHDIEQQVAWYREALLQGAVESDGTIKVYGVFIAGTDTPICYTGNGPTSIANAYFIAACHPKRILAYEDCVEALRKLVPSVDWVVTNENLDQFNARAALAALDELGET